MEQKVEARNVRTLVTFCCWINDRFFGAIVRAPFFGPGPDFLEKSISSEIYIHRCQFLGRCKSVLGTALTFGGLLTLAIYSF